jgi:hypothetical protein
MQLTIVTSDLDLWSYIPLGIWTRAPSDPHLVNHIDLTDWGYVAILRQDLHQNPVFLP